jgi:hypothetical protein
MALGEDMLAGRKEGKMIVVVTPLNFLGEQNRRLLEEAEIVATAVIADNNGLLVCKA